VSECGLDHPDGLVPIGGVDEGGADDRPVRLLGTFISGCRSQVPGTWYRIDAEDRARPLENAHTGSAG